MPLVPRDIKNIAYALIEVAHDEGVVAEIARDLQCLHDVFATHPEFLRTLGEVALSLAQRRRAITHALEKRIHPFVIHALFILQQRGLLGHFTSFVSAAMTRGQRLAKHYDVHVTSAVPLIREERTHVLNALKRMYGGVQTLRERVDPAILGGLVLEIGDRRYDASITGKMKRLHSALLA